MLKSVYRWIFVKKMFVIIVVLFLVIYIISYQLPEFHKTRKKTTTAFLHRPRFQLEQNGDYWVYNNFMRSTSFALKGNASLTLTTHGTYRDLNHLKWLLVRWRAPISMAVYVDKNDFEILLDILHHIKFCTIFSMSCTQWISLQLVFHDKHMPNMLRRISLEYPFGFRCKRSNNKGTKRMSTLNNTDYPVNLLRNVARLNAQTYYILALEPGMFPTRRLVKNFLQFTQLYQIAKPRKRYLLSLIDDVYCLPVFPAVCEDSKLPKYKSELKVRLEPYLNGSLTLSPNDNAQLNKYRPWLSSSVRDGDMVIYEIAKQPELCHAYISSNAFEPLYDQRYKDFTSDSNSTQLQVLVGLGFDFVVLDGTFVLQRRSNWQSDVFSDTSRSPPSAQKLKHIGELIKMNALALGSFYIEA